MFTNPAGNDLVISKPMTASVSTFTDILVGSFVSPDSAEVRFCNSNCTEYYSLISGAESVFYPGQGYREALEAKRRADRPRPILL